MEVRESIAYQYAAWCLEEGNIYVGRYVKKQAAAWLAITDGKNEEAYVCEKTFKKICNIMELMIHPDLGCPIYEGLEPYAWLLITAAFCTRSKKKEEYGIRYYETVLLEIARKNFKTFNSAVIFVIGMLTEPKFSRFFSVAPDLQLSSELKLAIRKIIKSSPLLNRSQIFKIHRTEIICPLTESEYTPLAYSNDRMDGKLANIFLADEAGALDEYPVEAMRSSQITLKEKLGIIISTQYPNDNNVMIDEIDISKKVLDGLLEEGKRRFSLLYEPDQEFTTGDIWQKEDRVIYQSNPAAVTEERMFERLKEKRSLAILYPNKRENYLCKHNNIKYKGLGKEGYVEITKLRKCRIEENKEIWKGKQVWLGLDFSLSEDNTAVAMVAEHEGMLIGKVFGFIPADRIEEKTKKEHVDYQKLIREGVCFACGDEVIDYSFVEDFIIGLPEEYEVEIMQIGYDKWNAVSSVQKLEAAGLECVEIKQHSSVLHMPTKFLKEMILKQMFQYETNKLLEINFQNARCTEDTNLNKYVNKKKSEGKVDMVVALINATYLIQQEILFGNDFVAQC